MAPWKSHWDLDLGDVLAPPDKYSDEEVVLCRDRNERSTTVRTRTKDFPDHSSSAYSSHTYWGEEIVEVTGENVLIDQQRLKVVADWEVVRELPA